MCARRIFLVIRDDVERRRKTDELVSTLIFRLIFHYVATA